MGLWISCQLLELPCRVVALTDAEWGKSEPVWEYSSALICGVKCQQPVQSVLLLTPAAWSAEHLLVLSFADFHVDVLFKWVEVQQGEGVIPGVGGPVGSRDAHLNLTSIHWLSCVVNLLWGYFLNKLSVLYCQQLVPVHCQLRLNLPANVLDISNLIIVIIRYICIKIRLPAKCNLNMPNNRLLRLM